MVWTNAIWFNVLADSKTIYVGVLCSVIRFSIKIDDKDIYKQLKKQNGKIEVGFFEGEKYPDGKSVAEVAAFNEFGGGHTPPRPFMRTLVQNHRKIWRKILQDELPKEDNAHTALATLAEYMVDDLKDYIKIWTYPPNAPSTIAKKGFNDPLVDTGRMMDSVDWRGDWQ